MAQHKILIVDKDEAFAKLLAEQLRSSGHENVDFVGSSSDAMIALKDNPYSVILGSETVEHVSGAELAFEVRKNQITKPEIVILSSERGLSLHEAHQAGASFVLPKPIDLAQLCSILNHITPSFERRAHPRVEISPQAMGQVYGEVSHFGKSNKIQVQISNLGRGGFYFRPGSVDALPKVGQILEFDLTLSMVPNTKFKGMGIVRWQRKRGAESGAGVEFLQIPDDAQKLIEAFVELFKVRPFVPDEC